MPTLAKSAPRALALILAAFCAIVTLSWATPALAHDRLLSSNPADGSEVLQGEIKDVTLNLSDEPIKLGNTIRVTDSKGTVLFDGEPVIDGMTARADLKGVPAPGELKVDWRIVSSDGHPISGTLTYTVKEDPSQPNSAASGAQAAAASDAGSSKAAASNSTASNAAASDSAGTPTVEPVVAPASSSHHFNWALWIPVIIVALIAIAVGIWIARDIEKKERNAHEHGE